MWSLRRGVQNACTGREGNTPQDLAVACGHQGSEALASRRSWASGAQCIRDRDQLVRVRALIAAPTDRGGDRVNRGSPVSVYDSLGSSHVVTFNFTNSGGNAWSYTATLPAADVTGSPAPTGPVTVASGTLQFSNTGTLTSPTTNPSLTLPVGDTLVSGAQSPTITWELTAPTTNTSLVTQVAGASATSSTQQDGYPAGTLQSFTIQGDGTIVGSFSNGQTSKLGQLALATFTNEEGLLQAANGNYMSTLASGLPSVGAPGAGGRGTLQDGALEGSNVDISTQFSNLILAQQAYEANARAINIQSEIFTQSTYNLGQ